MTGQLAQFSNSLVVQRSSCPDSIPCWETKIPQAVWHGQKKKVHTATRIWMWNLIRRQALSMTLRLLVLLLYSKYSSRTCPALHCYYTRVILCIDSSNSHDARVKCHSRHCAFKHRLSKKLTPHRNAGMTQNTMTITLKLSVTDLITPFFCLQHFLEEVDSGNRENLEAGFTIVG